MSHVSDIVGKEGAVYAVEFSHRSGALPQPACLRSVLGQGMRRRVQHCSPALHQGMPQSKMYTAAVQMAAHAQQGQPQGPGPPHAMPVKCLSSCTEVWVHCWHMSMSELHATGPLT